MYLSTNKYCLGNQWLETLILKSPSTFWTDVIKNWQLLCTKQQCRSNFDIMNTCFWYNSKITKEPLFFQNWYKNGITLIGDITDRDGKVKPIKDLIKCYSLNINILDYFRVKHLVQNFIDKFKLRDTFTYAKPSYPFHLQILSKAKKGCKDFYNVLMQNVENPTAWTKWMNLVDTSEPNFWTNVYKVCFKSVQDNKFIWFQYRIINNILDTNNYLNKVKIQDYNTCHLCSASPETVNHLFAECDKALELWANVKQWVTNRTSIYLELNDTTKILGYITYDEKFWAANFILMVTRFYIYWCSKKKLDLNIFYLLRKIKSLYNEHRFLSELNGFQDIFDKRWTPWVNHSQIYNKV